LAGSSRQLAHLEELAAQLTTIPDGSLIGSRSTEEVERRQAASTLLEPLGELRRRMEGLEAMMADEATDMAAKLGEVAQVTREMAELQSLAQKARPSAHEEAAANGLTVRQPSPEEIISHASSGAGNVGGARPPPSSSRTPLSITAAAPAQGGELNLEAALAGLDLDGLLARLESGHTVT